MTKTKCDLCGKEGVNMYPLKSLDHDACGDRYRVMECCAVCKFTIEAAMEKAKNYIERRMGKSFLAYTFNAVCAKLMGAK